MLLTWGQCFSPADSKKQNKLKIAHCGDMIDLLFMFKFTLIKHIESISLFVLSHLCEYCLRYYRAPSCSYTTVKKSSLWASNF